MSQEKLDEVIRPNVSVESIKQQIGIWIAGIVIDMHKDKELMAELPALVEKFELAAPYVGGKYNVLKEIAAKLQPLIEKR